mgnify:CR=1 FL=1|tara:strand:+ start:980 stop:1552 length:573 start_codon:yes stop_codon:yes gene_type:complete
MIRLAVIGDIGSGKSYVAKKFGFPVFNADKEVTQLYKKNRKCFNRLKRILPKYVNSFPIKKSKLTEAVLTNKKNLKKIIKVIHPQIRREMNNFSKKNKNKKFVVLDIPLLLENKINKKKDILIFIEARKKEINKRLKKRSNIKIINRLRKLQLPLEFKKKKSHYIIENNFKDISVKKNVKRVMEKILLNA